MNNIVEVSGLTKKYGSITALNNINLTVPEGAVFGILGPNGSGKTTLLGLLLTILKPNAGEIRIFNEPPSAANRRRIGTLLETPNFYHYLSALQNLRIAAEIKQVAHPDYENILKAVSLWERRHSPFSTYSLGMKQRLAIASCLIGDPQVMIFDEPTNGLDPKGIAEIRQLIVNLAQAGKTIIMASHLLDEVEKVCTHVAILKQGHMLASGHVDEILHQDVQIQVGAENLEMLKNVLANYPGISRMESNSKNELMIYLPSGQADLAALNRFCFENGIVLNSLQARKQSLESKFIEITN